VEPEFYLVDEIRRAETEMGIDQVWDTLDRFLDVEDLQIMRTESSVITQYRDQEGNGAIAVDADYIHIRTGANFYDYDLYSNFAAISDGWAAADSLKRERELELRETVDNLYSRLPV